VIEVYVFFGLCTFVSGFTTFIAFSMSRLARDERKELEDRLMALSKPNAMLTHAGLRDTEPAKVDYVDEEREYAITHSNSREIHEFDRLGDD